MVKVELAWELQCQLGEGPAWFPAEGLLRFVDIKGGRIHEFDPVTGEGRSFDVGGQPSFIVGDGKGGLLVGSNLALHRFEDGALGKPLLSIPDRASNRTNDATVDQQGRLWLGTMDDTRSGIAGAVWCLEGGELRRAGAEAVITNGPAISPDGEWLYHVDTLQRLIWKFPFGPAPVLQGGKVIARIADGDGVPDGVVTDAEGCLWIGLYNGWGVRRYDPSGTLLQHIDMPVANITKIAFGGPDLTTAYATTARGGLSEDQLAAQPLAGSLLKFDAGVRGRELPPASGAFA